MYDGLGSVIGLTDALGQVIASYDYDEFGRIKSETGNSTNPFKYTGEFYDSETGFLYLRAKYYDASIGRFITKDTYKGQLNNPISLNHYTYVENNPLTKTDPSGHCPICVVYVWASAVLASPDLSTDINNISMDIAEGDYFAATLDTLSAAIPGVTGLGRAGAKVSEMVAGLNKFSKAEKMYKRWQSNNGL